MDQKLPDREMRNRPEQYEETVDPRNPAADPVTAAAVPTMWYYLGPFALILLVLGLAMYFWASDNRQADEVEPTTGTYQEGTPGGGSADPKPDNPREEEEFRGGVSR